MAESVLLVLSVLSLSVAVLVLYKAYQVYAHVVEDLHIAPLGLTDANQLLVEGWVRNIQNTQKYLTVEYKELNNKLDDLKAQKV